MSDRSPTARRLQQLIDDLGISQRELALRMPSHPNENTVGFWLQSRSTPDAERWEEIIDLSLELPLARQLSRTEAALCRHNTELWIAERRREGAA